MMKIVSSLFLTISVLLVSMSQTWFYLGYVLNKNLIATELCVNKDRSDNSCEGRCFLKNKLKDLQKDGIPGTQPPVSDKFQINYVLSEEPEESCDCKADRDINPRSEYPQYNSPWLDRIFVPPRHI